MLRFAPERLRWAVKHMRPKEEKEKVLHVAAFLPLLVLLAGDQTSRSAVTEERR